MDWVALAEQEARLTNLTSVTVRGKGKSVLKFGKNDDLGTSKQTVWNRGGDEVFATTNAIDKFSSSSASDTGTLTIEGHTVSGTGTDAKFTLVTQVVTLAGQAETSLTTPLARVQRAFNSNGTAYVGDIYIYEDDTVTGGVPQTTDNIHMLIMAGENQSYKACMTTADNEFAFITGLSAAVDKKQSAVVDFELEVLKPGGLFLPKLRVSASTTGTNTFFQPIRPFLIVENNCEIRVTAVSSANGTEVNAEFSAIMAEVI